MAAPAAPVQALIIVDIQSAFVTGASAVPAASILPKHVTDLLDRARQAGALIVHLQNDGPAGTLDEAGTPGWQLHLPVRPGPDEIVIRKTRDDGFASTPLADLLHHRRVDALAICGVMPEMCVSATARTSLTLGFRAVMPHDAHATYDIPAAPGISEAIPAAIVSRVAEWALGDRIEIFAHAADIAFIAPPTSERPD